MATVKDYAEAFRIFVKYANNWHVVEIYSDGKINVSLNPLDVSQDDLKRLRWLGWYANYEFHNFYRRDLPKD